MILSISSKNIIENKYLLHNNYLKVLKIEFWINYRSTIYFDRLNSMIFRKILEIINFIHIHIINLFGLFCNLHFCDHYIKCHHYFYNKACQSTVVNKTSLVSHLNLPILKYSFWKAITQVYIDLESIMLSNYFNSRCFAEKLSRKSIEWRQRLAGQLPVWWQLHLEWKSLMVVPGFVHIAEKE